MEVIGGNFGMLYIIVIAIAARQMLDDDESWCKRSLQARPEPNRPSALKGEMDISSTMVHKDPPHKEKVSRAAYCWVSKGGPSKPTSWTEAPPAVERAVLWSDLTTEKEVLQRIHRMNAEQGNQSEVYSARDRRRLMLARLAFCPIADLGIPEVCGTLKNDEKMVSVKTEQAQDMGDVLRRGKTADIVPEKESKQATQAEVKDTVERTKEQWSCINKTTVSACTLLTQPTTRATISMTSTQVGAGSSRLIVRAATPSVRPNSPRLTPAAPPSSGSFLTLPPITSQSGNAQEVILNGGDDVLTLIDLEDEQNIQEANNMKEEVLETQTSRNMATIKTMVSEHSPIIEKGVVYAAGPTMTAPPLKPVSRGASRAASAQDNVNGKSSRPLSTLMGEHTFRNGVHPSCTTFNSQSIITDEEMKCPVNLLSRDASVQRPVTDVSGGRRKNKTEQRVREEEKNCEGMKNRKKPKWWRRLLLLPCLCVKYGNKQQ
ncbi:uncharacterized protein LOC143480567 isoform X1 [Brachyhypopomus gauderio]|uniref:uncharacterized protein LOC143480567 isoform X1 n=1 Tax=Brachyhypopomus gauderio TaxID=698409 RepID=UPI004040EF19